MKARGELRSRVEVDEIGEADMVGSRCWDGNRGGVVPAGGEIPQAIYWKRHAVDIMARKRPIAGELRGNRHPLGIEEAMERAGRSYR
jgi:hypothetical protein